jgi:hypothetical protein
MVTEEAKLERRHLKEKEREGREGESEGVNEEEWEKKRLIPCKEKQCFLPGNTNCKEWISTVDLLAKLA